MITKETYFVKYTDGKSIWYAPGIKPNIENTDVEVRPMLFPAAGKVLRHKTTGQVSDGIWLKDTTQADYIEISPEPMEVQNGD